MMLAFSRLLIPPPTFWRMSVPELMAALGRPPGLCLPSGTPSRQDFATLAQLFPDRLD